MKTILIIEDEEDILELLEFTLLNEGYRVILRDNTKDVFDILDKENIDLLIVDRNLPGVEGSEFVKLMREYSYNEKVLFLSAKDSSEDVIEGFRRGGDDYITKPFDLNKLKERIRVLTENKNILKYKNMEYHIRNKKFFINKEEIKLTSLEYKLIEYFLKNTNKLLTRDELLFEVWGDDCSKQYKTVTVAIKRLKDKIDKNRNKEYIKAIRGEGYIFC